MSFGITDNQWVEPDEFPPVTCGECYNWERCPCGCDYGLCKVDYILTEEDYTCG